MEEISVEQYRELIKKENKFKAKKTLCKLNHLHDSKLESIRCDLLNVLLRGGAISQLKQQPRFVLHRGYRYRGKKVRRTVYFADFSYLEDGIRIVEDVKGCRTNVYKLKKKLLLYKCRNRKNWEFRET